MMWATIVCSTFADSPAIHHVNPDTNLNWKSVGQELGGEMVKLPALLEATGLQAGIERVEPLLLTVVLSPGTPISEFGATVVEWAFFKITGKGTSGQTESYVVMVTRFPYSVHRRWQFAELISGTHAEATLKSFLPLPPKAQVKSTFLNFVKGVFKPGVCMAVPDMVIEVIVYDPNVTALIGPLPSDDEIRKLVAQGD